MTCQHPNTEDVTSGDDPYVYAEVCTDCLASLPAGYNCTECEHDEIRLLNGEIIWTTTHACDQHR